MKLYFAFIQTLAAFIVSIAKIDKNKNKKIEWSEIMAFITGTLTPLVFNAKNLQTQAQAFFDKMKSLNYVEFKQVILDVVQMDLLPGELEELEGKIDRIAFAVYNWINSTEEIVKAFKEVFGNNRIEVVILPTEQKRTIPKTLTNAADVLTATRIEDD